MIEISHLTKKYGEHVAVDDLTLNIEPGKIYGFLGPNGAGKSTTMNMITGYIAATQGTVKVQGYDILKQPEQARKCIGYLPEMPPLYMDMTVWEYLRFAADLKKIPRDKKRRYTEEAMELAKITDMKNRLIRNLSKGYRQRTGLAQAVLGYPGVIILDEPTVGLDPRQMIEMRELIQSLGKQHTVILSSHILTEVKEICEYIFILSNGRLAASDTTQNLTARTSAGQEIRLLLKGSRQEIMAALKKADGRTAHGRTEDGRNEDKNHEDINGGSVQPDAFEIASIEHAEEDGCFRAVLKSSGKQGSRGAERQQDIREQVFYTFAKAGIPILEMTMGSKSLEQVFLELTTQAGGSVIEEHTEEEHIAGEDTAEKNMLKENTAAEENEQDIKSEIYNSQERDIHEGNLEKGI
ncbi:MAG: ABC transporter ATP-binding protein [Eubacterium sp.]|nr:ABC transporter ATP-binding protein [Eubacterium sp.]